MLRRCLPLLLAAFVGGLLVPLLPGPEVGVAMIACLGRLARWERIPSGKAFLQNH